MAALNYNGMIVRIALSLLMLAGAEAQALEAAYWRSDVPVRQGASRAEGRELLPAFRELLVRVTGTGSVLESPAVREAEAQVGEYIDRNEVVPAEGKRQRASLVFSEDKVTGLLLQAGFSVWEERPKVMMVWMEGAEPAIPPSAMSGRIIQESRKRGISIMRAQGLMDAMAQLPQGTELFRAPIGMWSGLAKRYDVPVVVLARALPPEEGVSGVLGEWRVIRDGVSTDFKEAFTGAEAFFAYLPHQLSELLAARSQWPELGVGQELYRVDGVGSLGAYVGVQMALGRAGIKGVMISRLESDRAWFRADRPEILPVMDARLVSIESPDGDDLVGRARASSCPLRVYRWQSDAVSGVSGSVAPE